MGHNLREISEGGGGGGTCPWCLPPPLPVLPTPMIVHTWSTAIFGNTSLKTDHFQPLFSMMLSSSCVCGGGGESELCVFKCMNKNCVYLSACDLVCFSHEQITQCHLPLYNSLQSSSSHWSTRYLNTGRLPPKTA